MNDFFKRKSVYITFFIISIFVILFETFRFITGDIKILDIAPFGGALILLLGMYAYKLSNDDER